MCSGPVPQHPPSRRAPAATHEAATVARSAGDMTSTKFQFGLVKYPDSGYTPIGPDHRFRTSSMAWGMASISLCMMLTTVGPIGMRASSTVTSSRFG
jgi:hypothetical protein